MDIYVDPDERDGLPSVHPEHEQRDNQRAALNLVRAHTSGRFGFMKSRAKTAAAAAKDKARVEETEEDEKNDDGTGAFGRRLREMAPQRENVDDVPPPRAGGPKQHRGMFSNGGGVLSSLLALQGGSGHARGGSTPSIASSTLNGGSSRASSLMTYGDSDSEEDEEARLKFTRENRMRRGMQAGWMTSGGMMTPGLFFSLSLGLLCIRSRSSRSFSSPPISRDSITSLQEVPSVPKQSILPKANLPNLAQPNELPSPSPPTILVVVLWKLTEVINDRSPPSLSSSPIDPAIMLLPHRRQTERLLRWNSARMQGGRARIRSRSWGKG